MILSDQWYGERIEEILLIRCRVCNRHCRWEYWITNNHGAKQWLNLDSMSFLTPAVKTPLGVGVTLRRETCASTSIWLQMTIKPQQGTAPGPKQPRKYPHYVSFSVHPNASLHLRNAHKEKALMSSWITFLLCFFPSHMFAEAQWHWCLSYHLV